MAPECLLVTPVRPTCPAEHADAEQGDEGATPAGIEEGNTASCAGVGYAGKAIDRDTCHLENLSPGSVPPRIEPVQRADATAASSAMATVKYVEDALST